MAEAPQALEVPPMHGGRPGKEQMFGDFLGMARRSPYAVTRSPKNRGSFYRDECCDCQTGQPYDPRQGPGPGRQGQPPGTGWQSPPGLGQPSGPQKPFQPTSQDPCSYAKEVLGGLGLTPELLDDCLRQMGGRRQSRTPAQRAKSRAQGRKRKVPTETYANREPKRRKGRGTLAGAKRPVYKWYAKGATRSRSLCRDTANNLIVRKSFCGK